jgi:hypothetical protein
VGRIQCFTRGADGALWQAWLENGQWFGWQNLGGVISSAPSAVAWSGDQIHVFARGAATSSMYHIYYSGGRWSGWEDLGEVISSAPGCVSWAAGRIDCFASGSDSLAYSADAGILWRFYQ